MLLKTLISINYSPREVGQKVILRWYITFIYHMIWHSILPKTCLATKPLRPHWKYFYKCLWGAQVSLAFYILLIYLSLLVLSTMVFIPIDYLFQTVQCLLTDTVLYLFYSMYFIFFVCIDCIKLNLVNTIKSNQICLLLPLKKVRKQSGDAMHNV